MFFFTITRNLVREILFRDITSPLIKVCMQCSDDAVMTPDRVSWAYFDTTVLTSGVYDFELKSGELLDTVGILFRKKMFFLKAGSFSSHMVVFLFSYYVCIA